MGYREFAAPPGLHSLIECGWATTGLGNQARILPDGCMDLIRIGDQTVVAGPDTAAFLTRCGPEPVRGLRFHPGMLPRLLGVPAAELRNTRVALRELRAIGSDRTLQELAVTLAADPPRPETAPWSLATLEQVTRRLASGASVADTARQAGWSARTLQRQCAAVYGYGPAMLRRVLRFRRAMRLLHTGLTPAGVAASAGYADQPHLHREVRALAGVGIRQLGQPSSAANRSTEVPSGSSTVA
ncbi:AraC-like DNA-binding protein [Mycobacterium frederiksbergense]|uniref:AraC-like DNA-binding protein n=1 Tax=Mycolicibacterium frederiksbergense TaxID=117567 RepID=A0ABT6L1R8_9MYCO|nr:AraC family transcriptional regulator [Mycolicibacterium frederiksbergense]MDH6196157.1 AraC-like DNA-binding protein [Mycolicibacterium frederiksbergense]